MSRIIAQNLILCLNSYMIRWIISFIWTATVAPWSTFFRPLRQVDHEAVAYAMVACLTKEDKIGNLVAVTEQELCSAITEVKSMSHLARISEKDQFLDLRGFDECCALFEILINQLYINKELRFDLSMSFPGAWSKEPLIRSIALSGSEPDSRLMRYLPTLIQALRRSMIARACGFMVELRISFVGDVAIGPNLLHVGSFYNQDFKESDVLPVFLRRVEKLKEAQVADALRWHKAVDPRCYVQDLRQPLLVQDIETALRRLLTGYIMYYA